jgi:hypothetical protein
MNEQTSHLVHEVFALLGVDNFKDLSLAYSREDQKLMKSQEWDPQNPALITNKVKTILEQIDPKGLEESERSWYFEVLWFWYHHAVSCTSWVTDRSLAQAYATKALALQEECQPESFGQPNRITRLLWLLVHDKVDQAREWIANKPAGADEVEHKNGLELIEEYEQRKFK